MGKIDDILGKLGIKIVGITDKDENTKLRTQRIIEEISHTKSALKKLAEELMGEDKDDYAKTSKKDRIRILGYNQRGQEIRSKIEKIWGAK